MYRCNLHTYHIIERSNWFVRLFLHLFIQLPLPVVPLFIIVNLLITTASSQERSAWSVLPAAPPPPLPRPQPPTTPPTPPGRAQMAPPALLATPGPVPSCSSATWPSARLPLPAAPSLGLPQPVAPWAVPLHSPNLRRYKHKAEGSTGLLLGNHLETPGCH